MEQQDPSNPYQQTQVEAPTAAPAEQPNMVLSIVSLVLGIVGFPLGCCCTPFFAHVPFSIAAIVTGMMAMKKVKEGTGGGHGLALAGAICGGVSLVALTILHVLYWTGMIAGGIAESF